MAKTLFDIREEAELMEKLRAADPTGKWISDFVHSDNPKFAGKSKKERIRMALGAAYGAKRQNEETEIEEEYYVKVNNALKTTPSGAHVMKFPTREGAERHAKEHKKRNPNHQVSVTNSAASNAAVWHGGTKTRPYAMAEQENMHRIGLTVTDPNHPMVSKRKETIQKTIRIKGDDRETAIKGAIAHYKRKGYKVHDHHYIGTVNEEIDLDEAIKLGSKVMIHAPGKSYHGKTGHVGEIRNGAFKGAPKTYTVDHDGGSIQLDKKNIKMHAEEVGIDEAAWGKDKLANLQAAHARHSEKAIAANKAGDHEAVKVHMSKMNMVKNQMNKIKQNEDVKLDEAGGMKSAALVKAMMRKQKQTAVMSPEKQAQQKQEYQDKKQQNEMSNITFDNTGQSVGVSAGSMSHSGLVKPVHLIKPEKDAQARARSLKHKEKKMKTEAKSLYDRHQELRKKSGLPDPSHYLKLAKQKQAEIDAMKADQGSTERLHTVAPEPHPGGQRTFTGLRNK